MPIKPWFNDENDQELKEMIPILDSLSKVKDVRVIIQNIIDKMSTNLDTMKKKPYALYDDPKNIKYKDR